MAINIPLPVDVNQLFDLPPCDSIKLPAPQPLKITLPTGGSMQAFADISKGIPTDCAMTFSLMLQIAPFLASTDCLFKLLAIIGPLIDVVKGLGPPPDPIKLGSAIPKFLSAAEKLAPCLLVITGAPLIPFLRDLLCLIIKALNCFLGQLKTLLGIMNGISLQLSIAQASGNADLSSQLQCAQQNAELQAQHLTASIEPIGVILELAGSLMELAGVGPIKLPTVGSQTDLNSLNQVIQTIQGVVGTLQIAADALGGCDS
ncbi:MAG: hypothetical protein JO347_06445 [Candidatus Eremiobacteraeota bacterium]|nr:hypothetical protein [Candidatus Eremiobacteraeota bacterium]